MAELKVGTRAVGDGHPVFVIAEISANHGQDLERARELVRLAAAAGADAVKLQTYTPDTMTIDSDRPPFVIGPGTPWSGRTLYDLYGEAYTPWEWHEALRDEAEGAGVQFLSSPFDRTAVDFLDELGVPAFKIASFELVDHQLVEYAASKGKPLILSTGMATHEEIDEAVGVATRAGAAGVALLRCNSAYPAAPEEMDLRTISDMQRRWRVPVGLSDHTLGLAAATAAIALGASVIEKHFTVSRAEPGPDAAFSLEPSEFAELVAAVREVEATLGSVRYGPSPRERSSLVFRRSLFVITDIRAGERFTEENVRAIRPGDGLAPKELSRVLGRTAAVDVARGTPLSWELVGD